MPSSLEELVTLPGVGRKTATLVMILAFQSRQHICVDTHVHRISNRLGWVQTATPEETEQALYAATDARWWPYLNLYLVTWGQNTCRPVYPRCGRLCHRGRLPAPRRDEGRPLEKRRVLMFTRVPRLALSLALVALAVRPGVGAGPGARRARPARSWSSRRRRACSSSRRIPAEAPKTVARIVELVKQRFYNGMRIHRVVPGFVIQMGDPQTRDMTKKDRWGTGGSGKPIGVAEISKNRTARARARWPWPTPAIRPRPTASSTSRWRRCRG